MSCKYLSKLKGRFYAGFIDFSRAFDGICHNLLFHQLMKSGIHGQILKVIRSMCEQLKACVSTDNGLTEWFKCVIGTRQGCMLSPLLLALYLN